MTDHNYEIRVDQAGVWGWTCDPCGIARDDFLSLSAAERDAKLAHGEAV